LLRFPSSHGPLSPFIDDTLGTLSNPVAPFSEGPSSTYRKLSATFSTSSELGVLLVRVSLTGVRAPSLLLSSMMSNLPTSYLFPPPTTSPPFLGSILSDLFRKGPGSFGPCSPLFEFAHFFHSYLLFGLNGLFPEQFSLKFLLRLSCTSFSCTRQSTLLLPQPLPSTSCTSPLIADSLNAVAPMPVASGRARWRSLFFFAPNLSSRDLRWHVACYNRFLFSISPRWVGDALSKFPQHLMHPQSASSIQYRIPLLSLPSGLYLQNCDEDAPPILVRLAIAFF